VIEITRAHISRSPAPEQRVHHNPPAIFFRDELPDADLFALGRILHDWPEQKIRDLLTKIHHRLPGGGGILLAEKATLRRQDRPQFQLTFSPPSICLSATEGKETHISASTATCSRTLDFRT
jgi:hypothetical protein